MTRDLRHVAPALVFGGTSVRFELEAINDADPVSAAIKLRELVGRAYALGHAAGYAEGVTDASCTRPHAPEEQA